MNRLKKISNNHICFIPLIILMLTSMIYLFFVGSQPLVRSEWTTHLVSFGRAKQMALEKESFLNRPVHPQEIKKYYTPRDNLSFGSVSDSMHKTDIHPPLYFWMLHPIVHHTGINRYVARILNIILFIITGFLFYHLSYIITKNKYMANIILVLWAISYPTVLVIMKARQYMLLTTLTVGSITYLIHILYLNKIKIYHYVGYITILLAGFLTQYQFFFVALGLSVIIFFHCVSSKKINQLLNFFLSTILAFLLFYYIFPALPDHLEKLSGRNLSSMLPFTERLYRTILAINEYFPHIPVLIILLIFGIGFLYISKQSILNKNTLKEILSPQGKFLLYIIILFTIIIGCTAGIFLIGNAPNHMMNSAKRIAFIFPICLLTIVGILNMSLINNKFKYIFLIIWILLSIQSSAQFLTKKEKPNFVPDNVIKQHSLIFFNHDHREIFPELIFSMNEKALIFMTRNHKMLQKDLRNVISLVKKEKEALFVLMIRPNNKKKRQEVKEFVNKLSHQFNLNEIRTPKNWLLAYEATV